MKRYKIIAAVFTFIIAFFILGGSVITHAEGKRNRLYREMIEQSEDVYEKEVRNTLNDMGFKNAGVNLTKFYDENKDITYRVVVNHHSFEYASDEKIRMIENSLYEIADGCLEGSIETEISY